LKPFSLLILLLFLFGLNCSAQNFQLQVFGSTASENKIIDSLGYNPKHTNTKSISDEIAVMSGKLLKTGFIENQILENIKENDSSFIAKFHLGERVKSIHIYIGRKILSPSDSYRNLSKGEGDETLKKYSVSNSVLLKELIGLDAKTDTLVLPYSETETFMNQTLQKLEQKGFSLAKLKLVHIQKHQNNLYAELQLESDQQRQLNEIVINYSDNNKKNYFPEGHLKQINRKYRNRSFNQEIVRKINDDFEKFRFVSQVKYPEILFTKDTTKVYVYLEKRKPNTFDGFIGFSTTENSKLTFNGYLDLTLENTLHIGEQFTLYWKSDGNKQKSFKAGIEIPYLFKSPIGLKAQINIFKQDSTYQNTRTAIDLGYFIDYNTRIYLGYQSTESSDIQNINSAMISDYKNSYISSNLEYSKFDSVNPLFLKKTSLSFSTGIGKRATSSLPETAGTDKQFYINLNAMYHFYLNKKNSIFISSQNYYLHSDSYIINELFRFGGINSIRGFAENSLQANLLTSIISEYRYLLSPSLYLHSILDYGYFKDQSGREESNNKGSLLGVGIGIGLQTKNGLLKLAFANGSSKNQEIKFYNTLIHICYNVKF
jgi:hypothetical protein